MVTYICKQCDNPIGFVANKLGVCPWCDPKCLSLLPPMEVESFEMVSKLCEGDE